MKLVKFFKSDLFSKKLIKYFIKNIKKIDTLKGSYVFKDGRNVSDIVFITKK